MTYQTNTAYKNVYFASTTHTSAQYAGVWGTTAGITGSQATYTPTSDATSVIYEISFYSDNIERMNLYWVKIQESTDSGSTWSDVNARFGNNFGMASSGSPTGQGQNTYIHYRYIIPAWSSSRMLRTAITGSETWVTNARLHELTEFDGSTQTKYVNTNLLIHSI